MAFLGHAPDEFFPDIFVRKRLCRFIYIINYFHTVFSEQAGKTVVFFLRHFEIRNVVKEKALEIIRYKSLYFLTDPV